MCSKEPTVPPIGAKEPLYSVAKARAYYDGASCTTRTIVEPGPLTPGDYSLDWEQAEVSLDSLLSSVDVPIDMQYRYYRYLQPEPDSVELVPIYSKLVVVKEHPTLLEGCYIRHLMPARSMISAYPDYDYDALLNSRPKTDFSGVSLYTDLNGWPMCIGYYYEGELLVDAFLFDRAYSLEENIARMSDLLGDLTVARCSKVETRAQKDSPVLDGGEIEEVVCIGQRPQTEDPEPEIVVDKNSDHPKPIHFQVENGLGSGGSSSSSNNSSDNNDNSSKHNDKIKFEDEETEEAVEPLLDSISQDCMGKTLLEALDGVTIKIGAGQDQFIKNTIFLENDKTYGYRDYVLMEELIHCYQRQIQGTNANLRELDNEIEAKVGWYLYKQYRAKKNLNQQQLQQAFGPRKGQTAFESLALFYITDANNNDYYYNKYYLDAIETLRRLPSYKGMTISTDPNDRIFKTLQQLNADCDITL